MIIKGLANKKQLVAWILPALLIALFIGLVTLKVGFFSTFNQAAISNGEVYTCGAETVEGAFFVENGVKFGGGQTQSTAFVRTGKHASELNDEHLYGITYEIQNPTPGQTYKAEVWQYKKLNTVAYLAASAEDAVDFYGQTSQIVETAGNWWQKIEYIFTIPKNKPLKSLKIYVYKNADGKSIWLDDFKITTLEGISNLAIEGFSPNSFFMQIDKNGENKLQTIKERAFSQGILMQTDDDWVKSKVTTANGIKKAKVRYKGDWLDHLFNGRSSFRIQLKSEDSWLGMQTFSIQSPTTRSMLREWVYHQFLGYADVLSPRYDFINFHYNEASPIIYAYEEHFNKNLVENQLRREGPIIKFTEDRFWEGIARSTKFSQRLADASNKEKAFWGAETKPFKEGKTEKSPNLSQAFTIAQNLLEQYKYGLKKPEEVFDINLMAKYLAISELLQAEHTLTWHNQRFYYNPVTALLEPIGFDGYGGDSPDDPNAPLYSEKVYAQKGYSTEPIDRLFYDKTFMNLFLKYLNEYSQPAFIKQFMSEIEESLNAREQFLKIDYKEYSYDRTSILKRGQKIQENILPFSNSLQVFKKEVNGDSMTLALKTAHILPLEIVAVGKGKKEIEHTVLVFPTKQGEVPIYTKIVVPNWATKLSYRLPGVDSVHTLRIPAWNTPKSWSPRQELLAEVETGKKYYEETGNVILFRKKLHKINTPLILPKGKKVVVEPGAHFQFSNGAFLISFSSIEMRGDEEEEIVVESMDEKSGSFTIIQAEKPSFLRYVIFKKQNTLAYKGWNLTGAVTFYESDVNIVACRFLENECEDILNIVRSKFEVKDCFFKDVFGDAFDADFCKGVVQRCIFENIGNDALDFSTSVIDITSSTMKIVGDKAISAGEQATISATDIKVMKANIGFASKDLSILTLDNVHISESSKGFTAYQKKPEYGAATINLKKHTMKEVKYPFMIEAGSVLNKN